MLRIFAKGLLLVAFMWLAMLACGNCSPKMQPPAETPVVTEHNHKNGVTVVRAYAEKARRDDLPDERPEESRPMLEYAVPDGDMGDMDDGDYFDDEDETPVTTSSGRTNTRPSTRPSQAQDFDPFSGDGEGEEEPSKPALNADDYKVALDVTNEITLSGTATLRVWIGLENYIPKAIPTTVRDTTTIPASLGDYARITPYAPDFTVGPEESQVMRIVPSGSSVLFSLTPEKEGEFLISARIELYDNPDLVGVAIPKTSDIVSVVVKVDTKRAVKSGLSELGAITWKEVKKFWAAIVAIFFGALLFLFRKFVRKKTGYAANGNDGAGSYTSEPESTEAGGGGDMADDPFPPADEGDGGDLADGEDPFA